MAMDAPSLPLALAVLFADISDSTGLYETLGDTRALRMVTDCLGRFSRSVDKHGGKVIKTIGDEIMCCFSSSEAAVLAASEMQSQLDRRCGAGAQSVMAARIGIAYGPVIIEHKDIFGDTVNLCARVVALANPWQILATRQSVEQLPPFLRPTCRLLDSMDVKGKSEQVTLYDVLWKNDANLTLLAGPTLLPGAAPALKLCLRYADRDYVLTTQQRALTLGRDANSDIVVSADSASRHHARIYARSGKFFLVDQSTNGSYLVTDDGSVLLRHEEAILMGCGQIGLGRHPAGNGGALDYRFEAL